VHTWLTAATTAAALALLTGCGVAHASPGTAGPHGATGIALADSEQSVSGQSCVAQRGWKSLTLANTLPAPAVTVPLGARIVVNVPRWSWGTATNVHVAHDRTLREECTVMLRGGGRRTIFLATAQGSTWVGATVQPASNLMMPVWGGDITVRGPHG
jgi:hypothetical protein